MLSKETIKEKIDNMERISYLPLVEQKLRIFEDFIENYGEEYAKKQISTFKAVAGTLVPLDQAKYCISVYEEILELKKED